MRTESFPIFDVLGTGYDVSLFNTIHWWSIDEEINNEELNMGQVQIADRWPFKYLRSFRGYIEINYL